MYRQSCRCARIDACLPAFASWQVLCFIVRASSNALPHHSVSVSFAIQRSSLITVLIRQKDAAVCSSTQKIKKVALPERLEFPTHWLEANVLTSLRPQKRNL